MEVLAAISAFVTAIKGAMDLIASHEKKIAALEVLVAAHDKELKPAPPPGTHFS